MDSEPRRYTQGGLFSKDRISADIQIKRMLSDDRRGRSDSTPNPSRLATVDLTTHDVHGFAIMTS